LGIKTCILKINACAASVPPLKKVFAFYKDLKLYKNNKDVLKKIELTL